jgi:hypothetical protein
MTGIDLSVPSNLAHSLSAPTSELVFIGVGRMSPSRSVGLITSEVMLICPAFIKLEKGD